LTTPRLYFFSVFFYLLIGLSNVPISRDDQLHGHTTSELRYDPACSEMSEFEIVKF
jgi:hypothetical protein